MLSMVSVVKKYSKYDGTQNTSKQASSYEIKTATQH